MNEAVVRLRPGSSLAMIYHANPCSACMLGFAQSDLVTRLCWIDNKVHAAAGNGTLFWEGGRRGEASAYNVYVPTVAVAP